MTANGCRDFSNQMVVGIFRISSATDNSGECTRGMTTPHVQEVMPKAIFEDVTRNLSLSQLFESAFGAKEAAARRTAGTADNVGSLPFEAAVRLEHVRVAA